MKSPPQDYFLVLHSHVNRFNFETEKDSWTEISIASRNILAKVQPRQGYGKSSTEITVSEKIHELQGFNLK